MRSCLLGFLLVWLACAASAQTVFIRSGEHETFSRIAIDLPPGATWSVTRRKNGALVSLRPDSLVLDSSNIFTRIPRIRLRSASADGPDLNLFFACDCILKTSLIEGAMLVLDVRDPPPKQADIERRQRDTATPSAPAKSGAAHHFEFGYGELFWPSADRMEKPKTTDLAIAGSPVPSSDKHERDHQPDPERGGMSELHLSQVTKAVGKAASQGLLEPTATMELDPVLGIPDENDNSQQGLAPVVRGKNPDANLVFRNAMDQPRFTNEKDVRTSEGLQCPDPQVLDVSSWGIEDEFSIQIATQRTRLNGEFDRLNRSAALAMARSYIYFGFGIEARRVLELDPDLAKENELLLVASDILEWGQGRADNALLPFTECKQAVALWSALAHEVPPINAVDNKDQLLKTLNSLPQHLREILGPLLVTRFLAIGQTELAQEIMRIVERSPTDASPDAMLAAADLAAEQGDVEREAYLLNSVLNSNSQSAPLALIRMVDAKLRKNETISPETATLAAAYAHELRDTDLGPDLRRIHVLARARSNQFQIAFDALDRLGKRDGVSSSRALRAKVFLILSQTGNDADFLRFAFPETQGPKSEFGDDVTTALAQRFFDLGFFDLASPFLLETATETANRDRRILRARIALNLQQPERVKAELAGLDGEDVDLLNARALFVQGAYDQAQQIYDRSGYTGDGSDMAWLAEDWKRLSLSDDQNITKFAELMGRAKQDAWQGRSEIENLPSLSDGQNLLRASQDFRAALGPVLTVTKAAIPAPLP
jgi:hypothetical protein